MCALVRWYKLVEGLEHANQCPVYRWEARPNQDQVSIISTSSIAEIAHILPVPIPVRGHDAQLYYRNLWLRKSL